MKICGRVGVYFEFIFFPCSVQSSITELGTTLHSHSVTTKALTHSQVVTLVTNSEPKLKINKNVKHLAKITSGN